MDYIFFFKKRFSFSLYRGPFQNKSNHNFFNIKVASGSLSINSIKKYNYTQHTCKIIRSQNFLEYIQTPKKKYFPSFCFSYNPYCISSLSTYDKFIYITLIYFTKFYLIWNNWEIFGVRYQDRDGGYDVSIKHIEV